MAVGVFLEMFVYTIQCCRIDWEKMCQNAQKRTAIKFFRPQGDQKLNLKVGEEMEICLSGSKEKMDGESSKIEPILTKACTPKILITRSIMILVVVGLLLVALCCLFLFDWPSIFPNHCLLKNGTLIPLINRADASNYECTVHIP
ncbi:unnamed protein product [Hymenolepis diminuta]|nr:unnamed protein product [Hymenolepis diminuta]